MARTTVAVAEAVQCARPDASDMAEQATPRGEVSSMRTPLIGRPCGSTTVPTKAGV
jgi:hypothetical protein